MRTFGVEEELLLVDASTGSPVAVAAQILRSPLVNESAAEPQLLAELQQEMIEVVTRPSRTTERLRADIETGRRLADAFARERGARAVALSTSPLSVDPHATAKSRYQSMLERYGMTARRNLACGFHIHVSVESPEEGVGVLDRIRVWLPVLLALSANSPFAGGEDTGYASYRFATWRQWPVAGPLPVFGTLSGYREHERQLLSSGVLLDEGMLYFDARLSRAHPTVEIRVADVLPDSRLAAALAALARGLVEVAAAEWRAGIPAPAVSADALRLDAWQAALRGLAGQLVHPLLRRLMPAVEVTRDLEERVRPALEASGDAEVVATALASLHRAGTGAERQRAVFRREGSLAAVVAAAADWTLDRTCLGASMPEHEPPVSAPSAA